MQCHCMMGLFPGINRAWLTIDSDIYIWTYEHGSDVAYYDGLNETILSVGLVQPKPGVFHSFIKYLLVLTTNTDIVVLGVSFSPGTGINEEIQLVPDPIFSLPTDGVLMTVIAGTKLGRLFFGGKDGCLYEIAYQVPLLNYSFIRTKITQILKLKKSCLVVVSQTLFLRKLKRQ